MWTLVASLGLLLQDDKELEDLRRKAAEEKKQETEEIPQRVGKLEKQAEKSKAMFKFEDGLKFSSEDGNFTAHVGGRLLFHIRDVFDRDPVAVSGTSPIAEDTFFIRQARLEISGTFFKDFEFKVQTDFPTGSSSTSGTLQDAFLGWKKYPVASFRAGQFKEPFSQEETTSTRFIDFDERSVLNRLAPARDIGLMLYGKFGEGIFEYELGVFNGQGRAVVDGNDDKDVALRLRTSPFVGSDMDLFRGLRMGAAFTYGNQDNPTATAATALDTTTTELGVAFFDPTTTITRDGTRVRWGLELSWLYGPFSLRAEYARRTDEVDFGATTDANVDFDAWYVAATWLLTGEKKPLENRVVPDKPFDLDQGGWGAFELAFRVASLEVDLPTGIAAPNDEVLVFTGGLNWYLTRNFRVSPNFVYEKYDNDITFSEGPEDSAFGYIVRFQIDF